MNNPDALAEFENSLNYSLLAAEAQKRLNRVSYDKRTQWNIAFAALRWAETSADEYWEWMRAE